MWMVWICSAKNETDTFLFPDDYVDGLDMFGEERNRYPIPFCFRMIMWMVWIVNGMNGIIYLAKTEVDSFLFPISLRIV